MSKFRISNINLKKYLNIKQNWGKFLMIVSPTTMTVLEKSIEENINLVYYFIALVAVVIGFFQDSTKEENIEDLQSEKDTLNERIERLNHNNEYLMNNLEAFPETIIKLISKDLDHGYDDRITIYRHEEKNERFIPLGRHSKNKNLKKIGRRAYPIDEGFISEAWERGEIHCEGLPNYHNNKKEYIKKVQEKVTIRKKTIENMNMKSRSYYCQTLNVNRDSVAIIVIESKNEELKNNVENIKKIIDSSIGELLLETISNNMIRGGSRNEQVSK